MFKNLKLFLIVAFWGILSIEGLSAANPKREFRSTWFTTVWNLDWPKSSGSTAQKAELTTYLDQLKAMNLTSVCFQVRSLCDAMYKSSYEPWSSALTGTRGSNPGWDPLAFVVEECHKRGMECYAWFNPFRWSTGTTYNTSYDQQWRNKGWILTYGSYSVLNPAIPEARQHSLDVLAEILNNYQVDGVVFDDYFYPNNIPQSSSAADYSLWANSGSSLSIGDWRRENVHIAIREFHALIKSLRPDVRFGISPAGVADTSAGKFGLSGCPGSDWQYSEIFSDPLQWLYEGTIDFISPQIYWTINHSTNPFDDITSWWSNTANHFGRHHYASQEIANLMSSGNSTTNWKECANQIKSSRNSTMNNASGVVFYSTAYLNGPSASGLGNYLKSDVFSTPCLQPEITWATNAPSYGKVSNLAYSSGKLTWTATTNGKAIIKYTVYAIPSSVTIANAKAFDGDGFDVQYLVDVTYSNNYTIPTAKQSNYWYAVCVYDGYSKEHEAAIVNYPEGEAEKATLISPINGATADWSAKFSWSQVSNATYTLEIAADANFSTLKHQVKNLTTNSSVVDLSNLESKTVYYWRVITTQQNKLDATSAVATFTTSTRPSAPKTSLISPANGASFEEDITFSWSKVDCDAYKLQISTFSDFSSIKYEKSMTTTSHELSLSTLGKGSYYWRVITSGSTLESTISDVRQFTITKVVVGNFESGYKITTDIDNTSYSANGYINISNLWLRSTSNSYGNYWFQENGSYNRGFCATQDYLYISGRTSNSSSAETLYLRKMDPSTGEIVSDLFLDSDAKIEFYPCNDVMKDSKENVLISNLTLNISSTPLVIFQVDTETGALTQRASLTSSKVSSSTRVDHATVTGDVESGNFVVYAAVSNSKNILRWKYVNGQLNSEELCTLSELYPSAATSLGIAPRVIPINDNEFFVVGGSTYLSRYSFSTGKMVDSFKNKTIYEPDDANDVVGIDANGGAWFVLNGTTYLVYPYGSNLNTNGYNFNLVKTDANISYSSMSLMWTLPKRGLGNVNSGTSQADIDYVAINENTGNIYMYVPGNGVCAYEIKDNGPLGVENIITDTFGMQICGNVVKFPSMASMVSIYNMMGKTEKVCSNVTEMELNLPKGVYVINAVIEGVIYREKIAIR